MSFRPKLCEVIGDYHIIDPDNGFYEVWYVNPHDDTDDEFINEYAEFHTARWHTLCHHNADVALQQAQVRK